jgi:hypothetical protein
LACMPNGHGRGRGDCRAGPARQSRQGRRRPVHGGSRVYGFEGPVRENGVMINRGRVNVVVIEPEKRNWLECAFRIITDHFQFFVKRV